ncbi:hypothetical protein KsCSTR_35120 [Candidatus Kuenenia stuttgartiensis]|uniref:Uncharacterized protein n=1 Tax=Kuenenia stuttgartiensis TaxID=174633 RepID=Q1Q6U5_KUEST|nr:hypothetical protein KsCSTR_35120 [Candidatus Kuenenia stuttgartiensis]CAJ73298.1 unknown protein [Candidatus Kuenenia stuttgartiensis]
MTLLFKLSPLRTIPLSLQVEYDIGSPFFSYLQRELTASILVSLRVFEKQFVNHNYLAPVI